MPMPPFQGSITALITPFKNGEVDARAYQRLVEWQIDQGTHGLVPVGTTGESPTLSHEEHKQVIELCIEAAAGRVPVIAGTGSNCTAEAVALTRHAKDAGADGVLVVTPYYNKPTQEGLYLHYKAINDAADIPIIIYNIPGRSVVDMSVDTMARLSKLTEHRRREGRDRQHGAGEPAARGAWARSSCSSQARMRPRSASWRMAARAASRSRPISRLRSARSFSSPASAAISSARSSFRTGSCRCTTRCSWNQIQAR